MFVACYISVIYLYVAFYEVLYQVFRQASIESFNFYSDSC